MDPKLTAKKLARAERRIAILEDMIEEKTRKLYLANQSLRQAIADVKEMARVMPGALLVVDRQEQTIESINESTRLLLDIPADEDLSGRDVREVFPDFDDVVEVVAATAEAPPKEAPWLAWDGTEIPVLVSTRVFAAGRGQAPRVVLVGADLRDRKQLERDLTQAQKLESIGQLAAGIAHEINTPMQFIGDNVNFLQSAFADLLRVVNAYEAIRGKKGDRHAMLEELKTAVEDADLDYLRERGGRAFERTRSGVERVANIVRGMKAFAHPGQELTMLEVQEVVETTLTVAHHEYRYVAEVETELEPGLIVPGYAGELHRVLVNLIVNAAHAMDGREGMGRITVKTWEDEDHVMVSISDTGGGIPEDIRHRIFDPFFTTKKVGRGTGQGLAMAHQVITELHGGRLSFESEMGVGTTFFIGLPKDVEARGAA